MRQLADNQGLREDARAQAERREAKEREVKHRRTEEREARRAANLERAAELALADGGEEREEKAEAAAPAAAPARSPRAWWQILRDEDPTLARHGYEGAWQHGESDLRVFGYPDGLEVHIHSGTGA